MKKTIIFLAILTNFCFSDEYDTSVNNPSDCHCQFLINEYYIQHSEYDVSRQIRQMIIDQKNFHKYFLDIETKKGLENELNGVLSTFNKTSSTMSDYSQMLFFTKQLVEELKITNRYGILNAKTLEDN